MILSKLLALKLCIPFLMKCDAKAWQWFCGMTQSLLITETINDTGLQTLKNLGESGSIALGTLSSAFPVSGQSKEAPQNRRWLLYCLELFCCIWWNSVTTPDVFKPQYDYCKCVFLQTACQGFIWAVFILHYWGSLNLLTVCHSPLQCVNWSHYSYWSCKDVHQRFELW